MYMFGVGLTFLGSRLYELHPAHKNFLNSDSVRPLFACVVLILILKLLGAILQLLLAKAECTVCTLSALNTLILQLEWA